MLIAHIRINDVIWILTLDLGR